MTVAAHRGLSPVRTVLDNGAVVIAKQSQTTPAVTVHAAFGAGTVFDPPHLSGLAHFVSRTIDRGTATRPAETIADELDRRGVSLATSVNRHVLSLVCTCLVDDLEPILQILADIVMHPVFPENEITTRRAEIITLIRQDDDNPAVVAMEGFLAELYGPSHGYGRRPRGTLDSVEAIDRDACSGSMRRGSARLRSPSSSSAISNQ